MLELLRCVFSALCSLSYHTLLPLSLPWSQRRTGKSCDAFSWQTWRRGEPTSPRRMGLMLAGTHPSATTPSRVRWGEVISLCFVVVIYRHCLLLVKRWPVPTRPFSCTSSYPQTCADKSTWEPGKKNSRWIHCIYCRCLTGRKHQNQIRTKRHEDRSNPYRMNVEVPLQTTVVPKITTTCSCSRPNPSSKPGSADEYRCTVRRRGSCSPTPCPADLTLALSLGDALQALPYQRHRRRDRNILLQVYISTLRGIVCSHLWQHTHAPRPFRVNTPTYFSVSPGIAVVRDYCKEWAKGYMVLCARNVGGDEATKRDTFVNVRVMFIVAEATDVAHTKHSASASVPRAKRTPFDR